jgi:CRP-like cAMP-binding protein
MIASLSIQERSGSLRDRLEAAHHYDVFSLSSGGVLFAPGTEKQQCFFGIAKGQMKLRWQSPGSSADVIEVLGAGQYFGLGFLDHHVCGATAVTDVAVQAFSISAARHIFKIDPELKKRETLETQREFIHRREILTASASQALPQRLAAYLAFISRFNTSEGRDPMVISDDTTCRVVAEYLRTDIEALSKALKQLSDLGAVEVAPPADLRIRDLNFLEYIAGSEDKVLAQ